MSDDDLSDFEKQLAAAKADTDDPLAKIVSVSVEPGSAVPTSGDTKGLAITLQRSSGATMTEWFACPQTWEPQHDLVALLCYLRICPEELNLQDLKGAEVPLRYDSESGWELDWEIISDTDLPERRFQ